MQFGAPGRRDQEPVHRIRNSIAGPANVRKRRISPIAMRPGEGLLSDHIGGAQLGPRERVLVPLLGRSMGGASSNAPGSGTAELTKLEIRPDLDNDEIAGWRRRGHRDADARRGARFCPGRWALAHHRDTHSYMAAFIPQWNGIGLRIGTSA